jgi:hypothetical protein
MALLPQTDCGSAKAIRPITVIDGTPRKIAIYWRQAMEWFSKKTSIAGVEIPNWTVALVAVVVILLLYSSMR